MLGGVVATVIIINTWLELGDDHSHAYKNKSSTCGWKREMSVFE